MLSASSQPWLQHRDFRSSEGLQSQCCISRRKQFLLKPLLGCRPYHWSIHMGTSCYMTCVLMDGLNSPCMPKLHLPSSSAPWQKQSVTSWGLITDVSLQADTLSALEMSGLNTLKNKSSDLRRLVPLWEFPVEQYQVSGRTFRHKLWIVLYLY